jgi:hypothetical protein
MHSRPTPTPSKYIYIYTYISIEIYTYMYICVCMHIYVYIQIKICYVLPSTPAVLLKGALCVCVFSPGSPQFQQPLEQCESTAASVVEALSALAVVEALSTLAAAPNLCSH